MWLNSIYILTYINANERIEIDSQPLVNWIVMLNNLLLSVRKAIGKHFINQDKDILIRLINYAVLPYSKKLIIAFSI